MKAKLTPKQKQFCEYYVSSAETCGNGLQSYALAYGYNLDNKSKYQSAKANAHKLLSNNAINEYISELLKEKKLTPEFVDNQLDFLIMQNANLNVKLQAITTYYKFRIGRTEESDEKNSIALSERARELAKQYLD